jgi:Flp pilus assembly protein TadG
MFEADHMIGRGRPGLLNTEPVRARGAVRRGIESLSALHHDRGGTAALEMGFVAPALFMFILGIAQFGYAFWVQNALDFSVTAAARCVSVNTVACSDDTATKTYASSASGADLPSSVFTVTLAAGGATCGGKTGNVVSASYPMSLMIPFVSVSLTLTSQACYPT